MKHRALRAAHWIERWTIIFGQACSWTLILLLAVIVLQIGLRYGFDRETIALSELQWHLYAVVVMVSLSYTQAHRAHVRVDFLHRMFSSRTRRFLEVFAMTAFVLPLAAFLVWEGSQFAWEAWRIGEKSPAPGGLPWRWLVKGLIPIGAALLFANGVATAIRAAMEEETPVTGHDQSAPDPGRQS